MSSIQPTYACFGCVDFANNARTLAYHRWACRTGRYEDPRCIPKIEQWICSCEADDEEWTNPVDDNACWYDPLIPESADFLGVIIRRVSGLRSSTFTREIVDGIAGGSILQQPLVKGKQLVFEVIILSSSCAGMDYGIQWMRRQIEDDTRCPKSGSTCSSCQGQLLTLRVHCGEEGEVYDTGLHSFSAAGTVDGFTLVEDEFPMGSQCCCAMRLATFTMQTESADSYSTEPVTTCEIDSSEEYIFSRLGNCTDPNAPVDFPCCPFCAATCDPCTTDPGCDCVPPFVLDPVTINEVAPCFSDPVCRCVGAACVSQIPSGYEAAFRLGLFAGWDPANVHFQRFGLRNVVFRIFENPDDLPCPDDGTTYDELVARYIPCAQIGVSWMPAGSNLVIDGLSGKIWLLCNGRCIDHSERVFTIDGSVFPLKSRCSSLVFTVEWDCLNVQQNNTPPALPSTATIETFVGFKL